MGQPSLPAQQALPTLTTARLRLRAMALGDAPDVFAYAKDPEVLRYTTGTPPHRLEDTQAFLESAVAATDGRIWAIQLCDQPTVIGAIEFSFLSPDTGSIHYVLGKPYWGRGLMTEAVDALCGWAVDAFPSMREIRTAVVEENAGSARVLEKCGFERIDAIVEQWPKKAEPVHLGIFRRSRA